MFVEDKVGCGIHCFCLYGVAPRPGQIDRPGVTTHITRHGHALVLVPGTARALVYSHILQFLDIIDAINTQYNIPIEILCMGTMIQLGTFQVSEFLNNIISN